MSAPSPAHLTMIVGSGRDLVRAAPLYRELRRRDTIRVALVLTGQERDADLSKNLNLVNVYFDGVPVPRDEGCVAGQGWTWTDNSKTALEFCEDACTSLESGDVTDIAIEIMCSEDQLVVI